MTTPEEIQRNIERTREHLSSDVDRLTDKVSPSAVMNRRVSRLKGTAASVREKVMGAMPDSQPIASANSSVQDAAGTIADAGRSAPQAVRRQAEGNPLAAGLIAFGVGALVSSMLPPSEPEKALAARAEQAAADAAEPLKQTAQQVGGQLQDSAQQSAQQVAEMAAGAARDTAEQAKGRAQHVTDPLHG